MTSRKKLYNNDHDIRIACQPVKCVQEVKFLGVILDNKLVFKPHIDHVANKLSKGIGILCRARNTLFENHLKTLHVSLLQPYLTYCITIWGHTYSTYLSKLHVITKKIVRVINHAEFNAHTSELFNMHFIQRKYVDFP